MSDLSIPCSCCNGAGRRSLTPEFESTFKTLKKIGPTSCGELTSRMKNAGLIPRDASVTLIYKRIDRMISAGLVRKLPDRALTKEGTQYKATLFEVV